MRFFRSLVSHYLCCRIIVVSTIVVLLCIVVAGSAKEAEQHVIPPPDQVNTLPGLVGPPKGTQFAGYASVYGEANPLPPGAKDQDLFYWFVGRDGADCNGEPTILWSNGGPGATSLWGFFLENGPYTIGGSTDAPELTPRPHAWNQFANYMIFDHPLGVGLSNVSESENALPHNASAGVQQLYQSLLNFLKAHPKIAQNPIILAGESYAGTYLPLLAQAIIAGNERFELKIDLKAVVIGDGWVNPWAQMATVTTYALTHGLITDKQKRELDTLNKTQVANAVSEISGVSLANIAAPVGASDGWDVVRDYLNREDLRRAVHANIDPPIDTWWSPMIEQLYASTVNDNFQGAMQELLDGGLQIIVLSGLNDGKDCNFLGTAAWMDLLTGDVASDFHASDPVHWTSIDGQLLGYIQENANGQLSFVKVRNAGHMAAGEQPLLIDLIMNKTGVAHRLQHNQDLLI